MRDTRRRILPRKGEVAGSCQTEGEERKRLFRVLPLRHLRCHLPLAGEDANTDRPQAALASCRPLIMSAAFSAIMIVGALVFDPISVGITEASTTRNP